MARAKYSLIIFVSLFLIGIASQVLQALLVRESLVVFYGNELSLGAVFGSWLVWIAVGSLMVIKLGKLGWVKDPNKGLSFIMLALPLVIIFQLVAVRGIRLVLDTPSIELIPLGELFPSVALLTMPGALAMGLAFPLACKALGENESKPMVRGISWLYMIEAAGAFIGGILFTFVFIQGLGIWRGIGLLSMVLPIIAWRLKPTGLTAIASALFGIVGLLLTITPVNDLVHSRLETFRFKMLQPGMTLLDAVETRYGHTAYARFGDQVSVVQDGRITSSYPQVEQIQQTAAYVYTQARDARKMLLFGSFASGLVSELLRYPVEHIDLVIQDREAFERLKPYLGKSHWEALEDQRLQIHFEDSRRYLRGLTGQAYDLVLVLDAAPSSAHDNRYFTREFYSGIRQQMSDKGVICTQVNSASNYLGGTVRSYAGSIFRTLAEEFSEVSILPGDIHVYCASNRPGQVSENPDELARRYLATGLNEYRFPAASFYSLMPKQRIRDLHQQFQAQPGLLNSDSRPVTFYLNMLMWARYTASALADWLETLGSKGVWPYLAPAIVFIGLWLLHSALSAAPAPNSRRQAGSFTLFLLGLVAMTLQLMVMFDYQAHVGFMFERIALLNGLFMTGLALGAGLLGQAMTLRGRPESWLIVLILSVVGMLVYTPDLFKLVADINGLSQELAYLGISCLYGLLTGTGFPLGVRLAQEELKAPLSTGGISEAADSLGGAIGGFVAGALLIPLLGVAGTCELLMIFSLLILLPLAYTRWLPARIEPLAARGFQAFPLSRLGWLLTFAVIVLYAWQLTMEDVKGRPQLHFDESVVSRVSGSEQLEPRDVPVPHYLGWDKKSARESSADTISLSSMVYASEIRGYGGPINLLVSMDSNGLIRGIHYVDSNETASYIDRIAAWLSSLIMLDLSDRALDLQRVDALTGATITSQASLEAINHTASQAGQLAFGKNFAQPTSKKETAQALWTPRFWLTLVLLAVSIPVFLSGNDKARLTLLAASLGILGFWLNSLVTEVDLVNLALGHLSSLSDNPQRWLLLGFVGLSGLFFGQFWCGNLCPFGALQEFISRLGRYLGLRRYASRPLDRFLRFLKYVFLALMLYALLLFNEKHWASFNPMQHAFSEHVTGWMLMILAASLAGALVYVRFWCRYFCPLGAFLSLGNKIALLQRFAPRRRFEHCDLGVRDEFDIDCIRCNRCVNGNDTHVVHRENRRGLG